MSISPEQLPQPPDSTASESGQPLEVLAVNPQAAPSPDNASASDDAENTGNSAEASSAPSAAGESPSPAPATPRFEPIPPPSEPMQYRAIGLVRGRYMPSANQFTQGILLTNDGTVIDAVLLGRIMSLVKNHLSLEQEHLWVVYPRTRQKDGHLHTQVVGVWEPETLKPTEAVGSGDFSTPIVDDYFSVRGEVVYQSQEEEYIVVKIRQAPRKPSDTPKFFKLKLKGTLPGKGVGNFWDLQVQRQAENLLIQEVKDIGPVPGKQKRKPGKPGKPRKGGRPPGGKPQKGAKPYPRKGPPAAPGAPTAPGAPGAAGAPAAPPAPPKRKEPIAKPVIKRRPPNPETEEGGKATGEG